MASGSTDLRQLAQQAQVHHPEFVVNSGADDGVVGLTPRVAARSLIGKIVVMNRTDHFQTYERLKER